MFNLFKKKDPAKRWLVSEESLFFWFLCIITAFILGVSKLGRMSTIIFIIMMYLYFKILRSIWKLLLKLFKGFVLSTVENGKKVDK